MSIDGTVIKQNISKNIVKYRELAGFSQKELAQKLDVTPSRVSNWEQGANCPTIDILFDVCKVLNVSINDIYGIYPDSNITLSYLEAEHIAKYRKLDESGRQLIDSIMSELIKMEESQAQKLIETENRLLAYEKAFQKYKIFSKHTSDNELLAAHARTDVKASSEDIQHDLDIMDDDSKWN